MAISSLFTTRAIGIAFIAFSLGIASLWVLSGNKPEGVSTLFSPIVSVEQRAFVVEVVESATLDARQSVLLSSDLPSNRAKVVYLVPEGEVVSAGDVVARFDKTAFEDDIQKLKTDIEEQKLKLKQAQAESALEETASNDRLAQMKYQKELARLKLEALREGGIPVRLAKAEKEVERASADYKADKSNLSTEEALFEKGLTNQKSLEEARNTASESRSALKLAKQSLRVLKEVNLPSELRQAELQLSNKQREIDAFVETQAQKRTKRLGAVSQTEHRIRAITQELEKTEAYLAKTEVRAPVTGLVLYKVISMQGEKRKVQVGDSLWARNSFAVIPDLSDMVAVAQIRENEVGKIVEGQAVQIQPEAYPQLKLAGKVQSIGTLAAQQSDSQGRYFNVRISLIDSNEKLRPGMTARVSILVNRYEDTIVIPVEAVFYEDTGPVAFLWRDGNPKRIDLALGDSDDDFVAVLQGLSAGQEVTLIYPESFDR